jgi:hypothetical protein
MARHYVLLDACVAAAYFAPKTTHSANLKSRAKTLLSGGAQGTDIRFIIPNFCIAEVFAVFEKYRWGKTWNKHVKVALTAAEFSAARKAFGAAIHNGSSILQVELDRYHILCVDLISPVNNAYKIKRDRTQKNNVTPAKAYDMLLVAMGIWLQHQYGSESFTVVTGDERLASVVERAKSAKLGRPMREHLSEAATSLGLAYSSALYPTVINLIHASKNELATRFPGLTPSW